MVKIPETKLTHFISLGAGVQSSTIALMAACGEIQPMPKYAVFADTQIEPPEVYEWLDKLEKLLPFPVKRVTRENLEEYTLRLRLKKDNSGCYVYSGIPAFTVKKDGGKGMTMRQCTTGFKIEPILRAVRELEQVPRGCKEKMVIQWIGISLDEIHRMKESREPWQENRWPLIEMRMNRHDCLQWMEKNGFPKPPKSACYFCPFKSNSQWQEMKDKNPSLFQRAILFEKMYGYLKDMVDSEITPYLHPSCKPLSEVDFKVDESPELWGNECEGMCGV